MSTVRALLEEQLPRARSDVAKDENLLAGLVGKRNYSSPGTALTGKEEKLLTKENDHRT